MARVNPSGHNLTASEARELRNSIANEFNRRNGYGSLSGYMNNRYFGGNGVEAVNTGGLIRATQGRVIIESLLQIEDIGDLNTVNIVPGKPIHKSFNSGLLKYVSDDLAKQGGSNKYTGNSTCRSACTGLCQGTCISTCYGCTSSCSAGCENNCSITCGRSCGSCSNGCYGTCYGSCNIDCKGNCAGCKTSCTTTCGNNCTGSNT